MLGGPISGTPVGGIRLIYPAEWAEKRELATHTEIDATFAAMHLLLVHYNIDLRPYVYANQAALFLV